MSIQFLKRGGGGKGKTICKLNTVNFLLFATTLLCNLYKVANWFIATNFHKQVYNYNLIQVQMTFKGLVHGHEYYHNKASANVLKFSCI